MNNTRIVDVCGSSGCKTCACSQQETVQACSVCGRSTFRWAYHPGGGSDRVCAECAGSVSFTLEICPVCNKVGDRWASADSVLGPTCGDCLNSPLPAKAIALANIPSGYHLRPITQGTFGKLSKIREELEEAEDAQEQNNPVMLLMELSDIIGAIEGVLNAEFGGGVSLANLVTMSDATKRAFLSGARKPKGGT